MLERISSTPQPGVQADGSPAAQNGQITGTTSINVGYVGSRSTRVITFGNANQPLPGTGDPSTWAPDQERRPFPQYGLIRWTASDGKINYHGLQTSVRRRRAAGFEFVNSASETAEGDAHLHRELLAVGLAEGRFHACRAQFLLDVIG